MRLLLLAALLWMPSCALFNAPFCYGDLGLSELGLVSADQRRWRIDTRVQAGILELAGKGGLCFASRAWPLVFIDARSGDFLGMVAYQTDPFPDLRDFQRFFDTFDTTLTRARYSRSCKPDEYAAVKRDFDIQQIQGRQVVTGFDPENLQELLFAVDWMQRCFHTKHPIAWLTPEGELIGVYRGRRFDVFGGPVRREVR